MLRSIVIAATVSLFPVSAFAESELGNVTCEAGSAGINAEAIMVKVNGMVCDFCAQSVTKVFQKRGHATSVDVDLDAGAILLETSGCSAVSDETIEELVHYSGYDLVSIERSPLLASIPSSGAEKTN